MRQRKQLWVQPEIQGTFILRVVFYWFECLLTVFFMTVCWTAISRPVGSVGDLFWNVATDNLPVLFASLLLLPLVVLDTLRVSHRFVGPLVRVRRAMRAIAAGESPGPITYRETDYWKEFADEVNRVIAYVDAQKQQRRLAEKLGVDDPADCQPVA